MTGKCELCEQYVQFSSETGTDICQDCHEALNYCWEKIGRSDLPEETVHGFGIRLRQMHDHFKKELGYNVSMRVAAVGLMVDYAAFKKNSRKQERQ